MSQIGRQLLALSGGVFASQATQLLIWPFEGKSWDSAYSSVPSCALLRPVRSLAPPSRPTLRAPVVLLTARAYYPDPVVISSLTTVFGTTLGFDS